MTTVLITNGVDPDVLCLERCRLRLRLRLLARLRSNELDQLLACGVSADADGLLSKKRAHAAQRSHPQETCS